MKWPTNNDQWFFLAHAMGNKHDIRLIRGPNLGSPNMSVYGKHLGALEPILGEIFVKLKAAGVSSATNGGSSVGGDVADAGGDVDDAGGDVEC